MPLFTKTLKLKAFTKNRFGRYLLYALGEVILVVLGILIALNINNLNEENNQKKILKGILNNVSYDLEQDTLLINYAIKYYEARSTVALDVINNKYELEDFRKCLLCNSMLIHYIPVKYNDKGYLQLKDFYGDSMGRDTLATQIVQFYNFSNSISDDVLTQVKNITTNTIIEWRDTQPWFSQIILGKIPEEYREYMTTQDFQNKIAHYYVISCQNYLNQLKRYKSGAVDILRRIKARDSLN